MIDIPTIEQLANDVCTSMLNLNVNPSQTTFRPDEVDLFFGHVGIEGEWQSQIFLACTESLARRCASAMFMAGISDLTTDEIGDAVGEMINMIAGNIKGVLPGENTLSLPTVEQIDAQQFAAAKGGQMDVTLECEGETMVIRFSQPVSMGVGVE